MPGRFSTEEIATAAGLTHNVDVWSDQSTGKTHFGTPAIAEVFNNTLLSLVDNRD